MRKKENIEVKTENCKAKVETKSSDIENFEKILNEISDAECIETIEINKEIIEVLSKMMEHRKLKGINALVEYIEDLENALINTNNTLDIFREALKKRGE